MNNRHSIDKICVSAWIPREVAQKLVRLAANKGETLTNVLIQVYEEATKDVELSREDYRKIAAQVEAARRRQDRRAIVFRARQETRRSEKTTKAKLSS